MLKTQRIDKWLFHARFIKSRTKATKLVSANKLRINDDKISKPSYLLKVGDVLTFRLNKEIKTIKILGINDTRRPFVEAQTLYDDQTPEPINSGARKFDKNSSPMLRDKGAGRPTKKHRRKMDQFIMDSVEF